MYYQTPDPRIIELNEKPFFEQTSTTSVDSASQVLDTDWAKYAFLIKDEVDLEGNLTTVSLEEIDARNRTFSSAYFKFEDTSPGGSKCINPRPQFTRYCDPSIPGMVYGRDENRITNYRGNTGMGRFYSETLNEYGQLVYMRFGVPQFNSLTNFFTGFYNNAAATAARTGRYNDSLMFSIGKTIGKAATLVGAVVFWPVTVTLALGRVFKFFTGQDTSKFYTFKPTMHTYWGIVNTIVNTIGVNKGLVPQGIKDANSRVQTDQRVQDVYKPDPDTLENISKLLPDVFSPTGGIDVYSIATRAQRLQQRMQTAQYQQWDQTSATDFYGYVKKIGQEKLDKAPGQADGFFGFIDKYLLNTDIYVQKESSENKNTNLEMDPRSTKTTETENPVKTSWGNYIEAEMNEGGAFACFRVDYTGPVNESFSNAVGENDLTSKINGASGQSRNASFTFAGGNIGDGVVSEAIEGVMNAAKGVMEGVLEGLHISGLMSLAGNAFVDIPKHWQSSSANLPKSSYKMTFISPYGNPISQLINIYIPMAMLLAGALPLSTGRQSYTSPLICQLYDQGRSQSRLAIIDSLSFNRGTSNLGFNKANSPMAVEANFTVLDLSSIMHMPVSSAFTDGGDGIFDDQTVYFDYMAVLGSLGLYEQFNKVPLALLKEAQLLRKRQALTSPAMWASLIHEKTPVGLLDVFYRGSSTMSSSFSSARN